MARGGPVQDSVLTARDHHQPSDRDRIVSFEPTSLYHRSPDSGELESKPRRSKEAIWSHSLQRETSVRTECATSPPRAITGVPRS